MTEWEAITSIVSLLSLFLIVWLLIKANNTLMSIELLLLQSDEWRRARDEEQKNEADTLQRSRSVGCQ